MDKHASTLEAGTASGDKSAVYEELERRVDALLSVETDPIANLANAAAEIYQTLPAVNWVGFYLVRATDLVLGPFQGKPARSRIPFDRGVCGAAASKRKSILVQDVHAFPDHIACDTASRSELVVPLIRDGTLIGVLDLDSPLAARFDLRDQAGCEALAAVIARHVGFGLAG